MDDASVPRDDARRLVFTFWGPMVDVRPMVRVSKSCSSVSARPRRLILFEGLINATKHSGSPLHRRASITLRTAKAVTFRGALTRKSIFCLSLIETSTSELLPELTAITALYTSIKLRSVVVLPLIWIVSFTAKDSGKSGSDVASGDTVRGREGIRQGKTGLHGGAAGAPCE